MGVFPPRIGVAIGLSVLLPYAPTVIDFIPVAYAGRAIPENSTGLPINASGYPIVDSGVRRAEYVYWLDNDRVIFVRYEPYPGREEVPLGGTTPIKLRERGFFIWDTKRGTVTPYQQDLGDTIGVCAFDHYVRLWGRADPLRF